jgi:hypothetical protein
VGLTQDGLAVRYDYRDTDETGLLIVEARFGGFAGESKAWFGDAELLTFSDQLRTYPLGDAQFTVSGGYGLGPGGEHVGLSVRAIDLRGLVGVLAHLATPHDYVDYRHSGTSASEARVEVLTSYASLGRFASELAQLVKGDLNEANLDADPL